MSCPRRTHSRCPASSPLGQPGPQCGPWPCPAAARAVSRRRRRWPADAAAGTAAVLLLPPLRPHAAQGRSAVPPLTPLTPLPARGEARLRGACNWPTSFAAIHASASSTVVGRAMIRQLATCMLSRPFATSASPTAFTAMRVCLLNLPGAKVVSEDDKVGTQHS